MNTMNSLKGALLSGLVFPGLGQIVLGHYKRGIGFMLMVSAILLIIVVKALQQAFAILEKIAAEGGQISTNTIMNAVTQASDLSQSFTFKLLLFLLLICWIIAVVDAYRIGKRKDTDPGTRHNKRRTTGS